MENEIVVKQDHFTFEELLDTLSPAELIEIARKKFTSRYTDWLTSSSFIGSKTDDTTVTFSYGLEILEDDIREHYADCKFDYNTEYKSIERIWY